jgi:hypothetical protein
MTSIVIGATPEQIVIDHISNTRCLGSRSSLTAPDGIWHHH